ncbi:MAG: CopG family transcriptional regulator, partial [Candidatus Omnitrophota bacterium]
LAEDQEDLAVFAKRAKEPTVSYEALLKKLKANGKI